MRSGCNASAGECRWATGATDALIYLILSMWAASAGAEEGTCFQGSGVSKSSRPAKLLGSVKSGQCLTGRAGDA